jgi:hypothetical protein
MLAAQNIPDDAVIINLENLVKNEREVIVDILDHLNEIEKRELHLKLGFPSLFAYATTRLRYSEPAASRRINTARAMREYPELGQKEKNM